MTDAVREGFDCPSFLADARDKGILLKVHQERIDIWAPRQALTSEFTRTLKDNKASILAFLSARPGPAAAALIDVTATETPASESFALTDIQRAYWVGRQQAFELGDVSIHFYTELDCASLDPVRLEAAWNQVVQHHEMLRAVVDEEGLQKITATPPYRVRIHDLRGHAGQAQVAALAALRDALSHKVHRSDEWPGFDIEIAQLDATRSRLFFGMDLLHIDGGSLLLLFDDLVQWYALPERVKDQAALRYRDYVLAEQALKQSARYAQDLAYWGEQVKTLPPPPQLPRRQSTSTGAARFSRRTFDIDATAFGRLRMQAATLGFTPTSYVMTAFADIVRTWNGAQDYTLNVTLFNRPPIHPDIHRIAGDFTSMVLMPVKHEHGESLAERARRMQQLLWQHLDHRLVSGITILDELRKASGSQEAAKLSVVFTSLLNLASQGFSSQWLHALGQPVYTVTQTPQVTLDHQVFENHHGGLTFSWDVIDDIFPKGLIEDMFGAYKDLIQALLSGNEAWQEVAPCHTPATHLALFESVNQTERDYPRDVSLRSLFLDAAQRHADCNALAHGKMGLRYRTVSGAVDQLALKLQRLGVCAGDKVLIYMDKSWTQAVAALGTHAAGAAYVPLDPAAPEKRLAHILADSGAKLVLLDDTSAPQWPTSLGCPTFVVDTRLLHAHPEPTTALPRPDAEDVSHIIYTSGSTGAPKGVPITHRQVVNRILDINARFDIQPGDAMLAITALHHDLSVYDVFGVLAAGATLVVPDADKRLDPGHWLALMCEHEVTLWNSVPAFAGMLAQHLTSSALQPTHLPALRWMILAGDWIPVSLPAQVRAHWPDITLIASGGPTETTIWDIWYPVGDVPPDWRSIPYGKPLSNTRYFVLDATGRPCPIWVQGEMHIAGDGVAKGYHNAPEQTAQRFIADPYTGNKLYRSGDLGRYLPDGNIEFLGRNDFQVKIHGQRIELAEIEKVALTHSHVRDAMALVSTTANGPQLRLFVAADMRPANEPDTGHIDQQEAEFKALGVAVSNPVERLLQKLEYRALAPRDAGALTPLDFPDAPQQRCSSQRVFDQATVAPTELARFLSPLRGVRDTASGEVGFAYGSAGGLYPVQVYLHLKHGAVEGLDEGLWRYHPLHDGLACVSPGPLSEDIHWSHNRAMVRSARWLVFLVADMAVIQAQYGSVAQAMSYLEAGMIAQSLRDMSASNGFGVCQIGDLDFAEVADRFQLSPKQVFLCALVAGPLPRATQARPSPETWQAALRDHLAEQLPPHMVPPVIVTLDKLPLTQNGKVDRHALMNLNTDLTAQPQAHEPPADDFETTVATILACELGCERISVTANFFDIGASSALLARCYPRIVEQTGRSFPLISLFRHPTVRSLARNVMKPGDAPPTPGDRRAAKQKQAMQSLKARRTH